MAGCVDIFTSRRTAFEKCKWWSQKNYTNKNTGRSSYELFCHKNAPSGEFWAEEIEGIAETMSASGDVRFTRYTVTISTNDDVQNKIHKNDFVEYQGRIWRIENIANQKIARMSQFCRKNVSGSHIFVLVS